MVFRFINLIIWALQTQASSASPTHCKVIIKMTTSHNGRREESVLYCVSCFGTPKHFGGCFKILFCRRGKIGLELTSLSSHSYWVVETDSKGWDGPVVKTWCYFSWGLKLDPLNPYMVVHNCLYLQLQGIGLLWLSRHLHSCVLTNTHVCKIIIEINNS